MVPHAVSTACSPSQGELEVRITKSASLYPFIRFPAQAREWGLGVSRGTHSSTTLGSAHPCRSKNRLLLVHDKKSFEMESKDLKHLGKLDKIVCQLKLFKIGGSILCFYFFFPVILVLQFSCIL